MSAKIVSSGALALVFIGGFSLAQSGCGEKKDGDTKPEPCDVPAIFQASCSDRICHSADEPAAFLDLVSAGLDDRLVGVPGSEDCGGQILVEPGNPSASLLFQKITQDDPSCGRPMPPRGDRLSDRDIECIREYIEKAEGGPSCETCGSLLCIELASNPAHCGACGNACGEGMVCAEGTCLDPCEEGTTLCGSECVDTETSNQNCGACGHRCGAGSTCKDAVCECDPGVTASFKADVLPILEASCGGNDCHSGPEPISSLRLTAADAYEQLVAVGSDVCDGATRVVPGKPGSSYLLDKMTGGAVCQGRRMPLFDDPLPDAAIEKFVGWICAGALDD